MDTSVPTSGFAETEGSGIPAANALRGRRRRNTEKLLLRISAAVASRLDLPAILDTILEEAMVAMAAQEGSIMMHHPKRERLEMLAARGLPEAVVNRGHIHRKGSIAEWVIEHNRPIIFNGLVKQSCISNDFFYNAQSLCLFTIGRPCV